MLNIVWKNEGNAFLVAKIRKEGFQKVFNAWTKSHFSNFEVGWWTFSCSRKYLSMVLKQIQIINGSVKTKKSCVSWKLFEMEFKFSKLVKIIVFRCLQANKMVEICLNGWNTLRVTDKVNRHLSKKIKKKKNEKKKSKFVKFFSYMDQFLS